LYVAAPVKNGVVRLAYPLSAIQAVTGQVRRELLRASALALLISIILAALAAQSVARRLRRIMTFAEQVAAGEFSSRISDPAFDEIAQVASALDRTARQLEKTFSELETSRKQLETLLNSMQDAVVAVSKERHIAWANGEMQRLLPGLMLRQALVEAIRDPNVLTILDDSLTHKATLTTRATAIVPGRIFQATTAPMPDGGAVIVLHDHTEVERVEKTRRDFIANVSHELRTPLTSIQGYTETLFDLDPLSESQREFLEIIRKNAARMSRLTEDLLKLARVESGEWKLQKQSVRASDLVDEAIQNLRGLARQHGVDLAVGQASDATVLADRDAIVQVFSNLVENGVKYGGDGQKLELGSRVAEGNVEFYVRDFGPGIAAEHLPRLFERFYRVDKARSREAGGTGLGLAIVKHIVLNHGGTVRVESELHHGATFYFTLPMAAEAHLRPTTAAPA
jgi:two-component system phosphate regulon sensor histidine kinase PhoR